MSILQKLSKSCVSSYKRKFKTSLCSFMQRKCYYIIIYILKEEQVKLNEFLIGKVFCVKERGAGCVFGCSPLLVLGPRNPLEIELLFRERERITLNYLQIRSLLMETASFPRAASRFPRYPLFLMDSGQSKSLYKQESLSC